jgi:hypothetical protein
MCFARSRVFTLRCNTNRNESPVLMLRHIRDANVDVAISMHRMEYFTLNRLDANLTSIIKPIIQENHQSHYPM